MKLKENDENNKIKSSGLFFHVDWYIFSDSLKKKALQSSEITATSTWLHATTQKTFIYIYTAVRTSDLASK